MKDIYIEYENGKKISYNINKVPFSEQELAKRVEEYYGKQNCDRCRFAVITASIAKLQQEIEENKLSENTKLLFPILQKLKNIYLEEK